MRTLSPEGEQAVIEIANRHGVSTDAVKTLLEAVAAGGGSMAQFSHPELGGSGQWLRGGMTMVGDMFNHGLKAKVDGICSELSGLMGDQRFAPSHQSQSQGGSSSQYQSSGGGGMMSGGSSLFAEGSASSSGQWWPTDLGNPAATGAQNAVRYAYFPDKSRLVIDNAGQVELFDTGDHAIGGFGQQQGSGGSVTFTSQHGTVRLDSLRRIGGETAAKQVVEEATEAAEAAEAAAPSSGGGDVFAAIERLADLKAKGVLTEEEFTAKKAELLKRI
jgi:hypothetical protein